MEGRTWSDEHKETVNRYISVRVSWQFSVQPIKIPLSLK